VAETRADFRRTLSKVALFSGLTDAQLQFLAEHAVPRQYAPGEMVFGKGQPCAGLHVIERGNIRIFRISSGGREQVLSIDGTVRELVSRNLSRLQAEGLLKLDGRHAVIPDLKAFEAELNPAE
jgi:hypothetical protein